MRMLSRPALQVLRFVDRYFVSVDNALVRKEARPKDVLKLVILFVPRPEVEVSDVRLFNSVRRLPIIPNAMVRRL